MTEPARYALHHPPLSHNVDWRTSVLCSGSSIWAGVGSFEQEAVLEFALLLYWTRILF